MPNIKVSFQITQYRMLTYRIPNLPINLQKKKNVQSNQSNLNAKEQDTACISKQLMQIIFLGDQCKSNRDPHRKPVMELGINIHGPRPTA